MASFAKVFNRLHRFARFAGVSYVNFRQTRGPKRINVIFRTLTGFAAPAYALSLFSAKEDTKNPSSNERVGYFAAVDKLHDKCKYKDAYALLEPKANGEFLKDSEFLWRLGRGLYNHTREVNDKDKAREKQLMQQAFDHIQESIKLNEGSSEAHKWFGILLDQIASYEGTKCRIEQSYEVEKHFRRALDLNPLNAGALYSLGVWHFEFADLPWYQQKVAAVVFAKPPQTTYQQALDLFLRAEKARPGFYSKNVLMIGKCYVRLNDNKNAILWLKQARDWPQEINDDRDAHLEAVSLLKQCGCKD